MMDGYDSLPIDMCPVCKSTPLTTPGLRFKIAPRCYHRICEGCVDRKFSSGKTECPISGCKHQYWKRDWKIQTFEDLQIEREVDIRRRVMKILEKDEDDFETKRDWDDFLEMREEMIMNLVLKTDVAATNRKLREFEEADGTKPKTKDSVIKAVRKEGDAEHQSLIKGLKKVVVAPAREPYDPFMGMPKKRDYYELRNDYDLTRYESTRKMGLHDVGGYDFQQYMDESLMRAFAGLGVFIEDDKAQHNQPTGLSNDKVMVGNQDDVF